MMLLLNPKYEHLRSWLEMMPEGFETEGEYVYGGRRNLIRKLTAPDGTVLNIKRYHAPGGANALIYSFGFRKPKGMRAYQYPKILRQLGIETPEQVAYIEERRHGLLGLSYFVSIQCPYRHRLYEMLEAKPDLYEGVAVALARFAAHMHNEHVQHLDFSPGNILWDNAEAAATAPEEAAERYVFSIVDINRMYFGPVDIHRGCRNFARLWGPKRFFLLLAHEYARQRGFDEDECERLILRYRADFWHRYALKHEVSFKLEL
jgi:hypothetical protein